MKRPTLSQLTAQPFDLLIIGGGITGAAVARDAALQGLKVALFEKDDFASGTSSKSSKMVHGGLRYLEHGDLMMVMEGCRERRLLLRNAGYLVHPLPFVIPIFDNDSRGAWQWRAGLWLYDILATFRNVAKHRMLPPDELRRLEPNLPPSGIQLGGLYYDAAMQDARLCLDTLRSAAHAGAICMNYAEVVGLHRGAKGNLAGARIRDVLNGTEHDISARVVVNAAGPWADRCAAMSDKAAAPRLRLSKGVHLVTRSVTQGRAILYIGPKDGRVLVIVPWLDYTLIGTTDTNYQGSPDEVAATPDDVAYLLEAAQSVLPGARLSPNDVLSTMAGVRPLLDVPGKNPSDLSRTHKLLCDPNGLISIVGGKYTTHRAMAAETVRRVIRQLGRDGVAPNTRSADTASLRLPGSDVADFEAFAQDARTRLTGRYAIDGQTANHLITTYGAEAEHLVEPCGNDPWLAERLSPYYPHIAAEVLWAFDREMTRDAADFFFRRTSIGYGPCGGQRCAEALISIARRLGISQAEDPQVFLSRWKQERHRSIDALAAR